MTWDELVPGTTVETARRIVAESDVRAFGALTGDHNALHEAAGEEAAGDGGGAAFGGPIAHGMLVASLAVGLIAAAGVTDGILVALLETSFRFCAPVRFGDEIRVGVRVADRRVSRDPERGVITFEADVINQKDEVVQEGRLVELVRRTQA